MKREIIDLSPERQLIINMIVSEDFLRDIAPLIQPDYFKTGYAKEVSKWVIEYYNHYKKAPGKDIQDIYENKRLEFHDDEHRENIAEFLSSISEEYSKKPNNIEFSFNNSKNYLKIRSMEVLKSDLEYALESGDVAKAEQLVGGYKRVEGITGEGVDLIQDTGKVASAFLDEGEVLFKVPGAYGDLWGALKRGDFIAVAAPMKRGKTWFLWDMADVAIHNNCKVVFFTLEMTTAQMVRRAWQSIMGQPKEQEDVLMPYFEEVRAGSYIIQSKIETRQPVKPNQVGANQKKLVRRLRGGNVKIVSVPGATVEDITTHLDNMAHYDNFIADVIIIDYADILADSRGTRGEYRHQLDDKWKKLRTMAQKRSSLVVTASQLSKNTYTKDADQTSLSEDVRKLAHVTGMVALNQTNEEAGKGIMRLGQLAIREGRKITEQVVALQCLSIGRPVLDSKYSSELLQDENIDDTIDNYEDEYKSLKRGR